MENNRYRKWAVEIRFLNGLPEGHKIGVNTKTYYKADSWLGAIRRYINGEDSDVLVIHLTKLVGEAKELLVLNPDNKDKTTGLLKDMIASLDRLISVYEECEKDWVVSCLQEIKADVNELIM